MSALRNHLSRPPRLESRQAGRLGRRAIELGLETLDVARIHELALISLVLPGATLASCDAQVHQAGKFFAETITPLEETHRTAQQANTHLARLNLQLRQRCSELDASTRELKREIVQRTRAERSLKRSERHYARLLDQSRVMQEQLRLLSRQLLSAQEEERKKISRELHDVIAQALAGINVRLSELKQAAALNTAGLEQNIASTQELVRRSVDIVHRFARELRPTVLDDLGLIPALRTFMTTFKEETGIRIRLTAYASVEQISNNQRTILYRIAQEALTNVSRHAHASEVAVRLRKTHGFVELSITDDGKGFHLNRLSPGKRSQRLGLLGMRERLEMVGGDFQILSNPGKGTTVLARIPLADTVQTPVTRTNPSPNQTHVQAH